MRVRLTVIARRPKGAVMMIGASSGPARGRAKARAASGRLARRRVPQAGARTTDDAAEVWRSDVVLKIAPPDEGEVRALGSGSILIGFLAPFSSPATTRALA